MSEYLPLAILLSACAGGEPEPTLSCEEESWESFTEPFLTTWCTPCHASTVPEVDRRGAPLGVDFDTWEGAHTYADRIVARTLDDERPMPPAGGPTETERIEIERWLQCGAEGPTDIPAPCSARVERQGDASQAGEPCAAGANAVTGSVHISADATRALDCLCEIDGDLIIDGSTSDVLLPLLWRVGGEIELRTGSVSFALPALSEAGAVRLVNTNVSSIDIDRLQTVGGLLLVSGGSLPETFLPARLQSVGSHFGLSNVGGITTLDLPRLESIGGDLVIEGNPSLARVVHTSDLESIGGALRVLDNPSLSAIEDFGFVYNIFGDVEIGGNSLSLIDALWTLRRVDGDLIIRDEPLLGTLAGFTALETVTGSITVQNTAATEIVGFDSLDEIGSILIESNPALASVGGSGPVSVLGNFRIEDNPSLAATPWLEGLEELQGSLMLSGLPLVTTVAGLSSLDTVSGDLVLSHNPALLDLGNTAISQIDGSLIVEDNAALASLLGLSELQSIGGDLVLRELPSLPEEQLQLLVESVTVGGSSTLEP